MHRLLLCLTLWLTPNLSFASGLDLEVWLERPGVQLVAVELYATWCKPCMEAVPRWRALHEKYRGQGLRLIVVSTRDPGGQCATPPWTPDEIICDDEGTLADALGAQQLPAAFLWSWEGKRLATRAEVGGVEAEIERWLKVRPRVAVEVEALPKGFGWDAAALQDNLRSQLLDDGSLQVVATAEERAALDKLIRESLSARYDEKAACELGQALPANNLLKVRVTGSGAQRRLHLLLLSAERGCLVASSSAPWSHEDPELTVGLALHPLIRQLRKPADLPGAQPLPQPPDRDGDGWADHRDRCPAEAETWNGSKDHDGCADDRLVSLLAVGPYALDTPPLLFQPNSARLAPEAQAAIEPLRQLFARNAKIELNITCRQPKPGPLARQRGKVILSRLVAAGLDASRLHVGPTEAGPEGCELYTDPT